MQIQELFLTSCVHRKQNQRMNEGRIEVVDSSTMRVVFLILLWSVLEIPEGGNTFESGLADGTLHSPIARAAPLFWRTIG